MNPEERREQFQREQARKELRDQFAMACLQGGACNWALSAEEIGNRCYSLADAMLAAR